jgi:hypothetical protein
LLNIVFLVKEITNITSNLTRRMQYILSTKWYQEGWVWWMNFRLWWPLKSVAVWGLSVVFREACNTNILTFRYDSIEIQSILIHVEFEDWLYIPVLKKGQLFTKIYNWKSRFL